MVGQKELVKAPTPGELSRVPYGEPTWLTKGYFSPYYTENHRKFQTAVRHFFQTVVAPESVKCEESGKKISQEVVDKMAYGDNSPLFFVPDTDREIGKSTSSPCALVQESTLKGEC